MVINVIIITTMMVLSQLIVIGHLRSKLCVIYIIAFNSYNNPKVNIISPIPGAENKAQGTSIICSKSLDQLEIHRT